MIPSLPQSVEKKSRRQSERLTCLRSRNGRGGFADGYSSTRKRVPLLFLRGHSRWFEIHPPRPVDFLSSAFERREVEPLDQYGKIKATLLAELSKVAPNRPAGIGLRDPNHLDAEVVFVVVEYKACAVQNREAFAQFVVVSRMACLISAMEQSRSALNWPFLPRFTRIEKSSPLGSETLLILSKSLVSSASDSVRSSSESLHLSD